MSHTKLLGYDFGDALVVLDKENDWHQRFIAGRDALSAVVLAHWKDKLTEDE